MKIYTVVIYFAKHEVPTGDKKSLYSSKVIESCNENVGRNFEDNTQNFTMVKSRKKTTKNSGTHKTLAGNRIIRDFFIFVGGISNEVTAKDLIEYIKDEINITFISIKVNTINDYNRSYRVTIQKKR